MSIYNNGMHGYGNTKSHCIKCAYLGINYIFNTHGLAIDSNWDMFVSVFTIVVRGVGRISDMGGQIILI